MRQRLGHIEPTASSLNGILIHAASVGEVQAAQPLIAALREHWPDHTITVTTQTPTGKRALHSQWGEAIQHLYFPVDTPSATYRFLQRLQPSIMSGYGYTAIVVAWLANLNPVVIALASFLLAGLRVGMETLQLDLQIPATFGGIMEGGILLAVLAGGFFSRFRLQLRRLG